MKKLINVTIGIVNSWLLSVNILNLGCGESKYEFKGSRILRRYVNYYLEYGLNITFVQSEFGERSEDGNYTGILGMLQNKVIDEPLFPFAIGEANEIVTYYSISKTMDVVVISLSPPTTMITMDLLKSLNGFEIDASGTLILSLLLWYFALKLRLITEHFMDYFSMLFQQQYPQINTTGNRLYYLLTLAVFFFLFEIETANFGSELSVVIKPKTIDSLQDILSFNVTPAVIDFFRTQESFRNRKDVIRKQILSKLENEGGIWKYDKLEKMVEIVPVFLDGRLCGIVPSVAVKMAPSFGCYLFREHILRLARLGKTLHVSPVIETQSFGHPQRFGLEREKKDAFLKLHSFILEHGFEQYIMREYGNIIVPPQRYFDCEGVFLFERGQAKFEPLRVKHYFGIIAILFVVYTMAFIVLIVEIVVKYACIAFAFLAHCNKSC